MTSPGLTGVPAAGTAVFDDLTAFKIGRRLRRALETVDGNDRIQEEQLAIGGKDLRVAAVAPQEAAALGDERRMIIGGNLHSDRNDIPW